ncbi:unnamed protein product, partial [Rangifer tarandus platyrhynchus]
MLEQQPLPFCAPRAAVSEGASLCPGVRSRASGGRARGCAGGQWQWGGRVRCSRILQDSQSRRSGSSCPPRKRVLRVHGAPSHALLVCLPGIPAEEGWERQCSAREVWTSQLDPI